MTSRDLRQANDFLVHDSTLVLTVEPAGRDRFGSWQVDWDNHARLLRVLKRTGFRIAADPALHRRHQRLSKYHRVASRGDLSVHCEVYPTGSKFEFYQDIVTVNRNGGRYDFDRVAKMPYLVRKAFELALRELKADLVGHGFLERTKVRSAVPDPLAYFNDRWDGEYEKRLGCHRFARDESGWPASSELQNYQRRDRDGADLTHGALRYLRTSQGYLLRGRVYGGIGGRWLFVYGPSLDDFTFGSAHEFFTCKPSEVPRKQHPNPATARKRAAGRVRDRMRAAVSAEDFEAAARLRDAARRIEAVKAAA